MGEITNYGKKISVVQQKANLNKDQTLQNFDGLKKVFRVEPKDDKKKIIVVSKI